MSYSKTALALILGMLPVAPVFSGTYELRIHENHQTIDGRSHVGVGVNGFSPAPLLHWKEGEDVEIKVINQMDRPTSIHWHGLILPFMMDGVPGISFDGIAPGKSFTYRFTLKQSGTYWYHGHTDFQEQEGLYGPIVIDPLENRDPPSDRSYPIVLSDWTDENPRRIFAKLKAQSDYYNFDRITVSDFLEEVRSKGLIEAFSENLEWGSMRMNQTDLSDVTGDTYSYLINGKGHQPPWIGEFKKGEVVRLHLINASAMTYFDVSIPGLEMLIIQSDGQSVQPVRASRIRIAVAETYDVLVRPEAGHAYAVFAESLDRTGSAMGILTSDPNLRPETPKRTDPKYLDVNAMMGGMAGMSMSEEGSKGSNETMAMPMASHVDMSGMTMAKMDMLHKKDNEPGVNKNSEMRHGDHDASTSMMRDGPVPGVDYPLEIEGYQPFKSEKAKPNSRSFDHEIKLRLTGNMMRYIWSFDDVVYDDAAPIRLKKGERVKITYINETMMNHPMHLHGMWQDLDNGQGERIPRKHTINVQPGQTTSVYVDVDAPGQWAFHCHLVYHMASGMFRKVIVE
jgi:CopA family copper-resistance protein